MRVHVCDLNVQQSQTKLQEKRPQVAKKMNKLLLLYRVFQGFYFSRELGSEIQTNERNKIYCQGLKFQTNEEAKKYPAKFSKEFSFCFPEFWVHGFSDTTKKKRKQSANSWFTDFQSQTKRTYQQSAKFTNALLSKGGVCVFKEGDGKNTKLPQSQNCYISLEDFCLSKQTTEIHSKKKKKQQD